MKKKRRSWRRLNKRTEKEGRGELKILIAAIITWICVPLFYWLAKKVSYENTWFLYLYKLWVIFLGIMFTLYLFVSA